MLRKRRLSLFDRGLRGCPILIRVRILSRRELCFCLCKVGPREVGVERKRRAYLFKCRHRRLVDLLELRHRRRVGHLHLIEVRLRLDERLAC